MRRQWARWNMQPRAIDTRLPYGPRLGQQRKQALTLVVGQTVGGDGSSGSMPYLQIASLTFDRVTALMSESAFIAAATTW